MRYLLMKAHVKAHLRRTKSGGTAQVSEHEDKRKKKEKAEIEKWIKRWEESGRVAYYSPRKHLVSLNGMRFQPVAEAIKRIKAALANDDG